MIRDQRRAHATAGYQKAAPPERPPMVNKQRDGSLIITLAASAIYRLDNETATRLWCELSRALERD